MNFFYHNIFIHIEAVLSTVQRVFEEKKWKTGERKKTSGRSIRTRVMKISISGSFLPEHFLIISIFLIYMYPQTKQTKIFPHACHQHQDENVYMKIDNAVLHITCHEYLIHSIERPIYFYASGDGGEMLCIYFWCQAFIFRFPHKISSTRFSSFFLSMRIVSFILSFVMAPSTCYVYFFNYSLIWKNFRWLDNFILLPSSIHFYSHALNWCFSV